MTAWTTAGWARRLLALDGDELTERWGRLTTDLSASPLASGSYLAFLQTLFAGRWLADPYIPGPYWRSGLYITLLPILSGWSHDDLRECLEAHPHRYARLRKGIVIPTALELDRSRLASPGGYRTP